MAGNTVDPAKYVARTIRVTRPHKLKSYPAEVDFLDLSGDLVGARVACADFEALTKAARLAYKLYEAKTHYQDTCIYIIGPSDPGVDIHKIGLTVNPYGRLSQLQIGNWHRLEVKGLIWPYNKAVTIERNAHLAAKEMGIWLSGEWLALGVDDAIELALKAARYSKVMVADSDAYLRNMGARVAAVGKAAIIGREAA